MKLRVSFLSVVPSPYQRDLFRALAQRPEVELRVHYLEAAAPDSPWPEKPLADFESVLPGRWFALGGARCHWNWPLPDLRECAVVVLNTLTSSLTGQWLMRTKLRRQRWMFWGEKMGRGGWLHTWLTAPLHRANGIAAIGSVAARDYRERFPEPRHYCIPYHCELAPFLAAPRHQVGDGIVFFFCGQMIARKGVDVLLGRIRATRRARAAPARRTRSRACPHCSRLCRKRSARGIEYAGFQAPEALPEFFAKAHVFVLPSRYDGWGVVVNQALGAGLPIVCSDMVGAGHDLVVEEINGLKFPAGDATALAERMQRFLNTPGIIESWGAVSRERALDYLPERGAARWVEALQEVAAA